MKKLSSSNLELVKYIVFGVLTTVVSIVSFDAFNYIIGAKYYLLNNILSWIVAVVFAFITNKIWVFDSKSFEKSILIKELFSFTLARIASLIIEEIGLVFLVDIVAFKALKFDLFNMNISGELLAKTIMQVIVVALNYVLSKKLIFRKKDYNED